MPSPASTTHSCSAPSSCWRCARRSSGIDAAQHLRQAGLLAPRTTVPAAAHEQLKWAGLVPSNPSGLPRDDADAERLRLAEARGDLERRLAGAAAMSDPLDVYLNVSLACSASFPVSARDPEALAAPAAAHPIVQWRLATCGRSHEDALRAFAEAHPRYVEADYWRGRYRTTMAASTIAGRTAVAFVSDPAARREARERMRAALTAIPGALAIAFDLAGITSVTSPRDALPLYERVTKAQPRHNEAWLGQGICLTYLERPREAIDALSHVVELGRWSVGDALYWRAWNRHAIGELEAAWADIEQARTTLYNTNVYGLAGRIAFDRKALDTARPLLEKAVELSDANCAAAWFLGLLHSTEERWLAGGAAFEAAEACYRARHHARAVGRAARGRRRRRRGRPGRAAGADGGGDPHRRTAGGAVGLQRRVQPGPRRRAGPIASAARSRRAAPGGQRPGARAAGVRGSLTRRTAHVAASAARHGAHSHTTSLVSTSRPRREKNDHTPIGETSIGRTGKCQRVSTNGAKKATPRPPLVIASSRPCDAAARASTSQMRQRRSGGRARIASVQRPASVTAASTEWLRPRWPRGWSRPQPKAMPDDVEIRHDGQHGPQHDQRGARARQPAGDQRRPHDRVGEHRGHDSGLLDGVDGARRAHASRWTVAGEKAGRQMATYSAPPGSGLL